jgi:signal transduction histidine kinase
MGAVFLTFFGVMTAAGSGLMAWIYSVTGRPPEIWTHVLSGLVGILLAAAIAFIIHWASHKFFNVGIEREKGWQLFNDLIDAMEKIAMGNFNVAIKEDNYGFFGAIVDSVNKMARELGSMERLRQDFISDVSHEIQSPLTSIRGFAALLKNGDITPELKSHYIEIIETESRRLSSLSDNLLKLSSLESGEPLSQSEYRLDRQIENIALMLEPQWREKELNMEAELERVAICADENLMSQVWINLLHNAVKFTPSGGVITIALQAGENGEICCRISDTGSGITLQDKLRVFERFYKADKARGRSLGGNGLGLSIVKKIVDLHGGRIELESEPQKGTTFRIYLPRLNSV